MHEWEKLMMIMAFTKENKLNISIEEATAGL